MGELIEATQAHSYLQSAAHAEICIGVFLAVLTETKVLRKI